MSEPEAPRTDPYAWVEREPVRVATGLIDFARSRFVRDDGPIERLTAREGALLAYLADAANRAVSRDALLAAVYGHTGLSFSRAADTAIARLRRKLEPDPDAPLVLYTVHGHGYRLRVDGAPATPEADPSASALDARAPRALGAPDAATPPAPLRPPLRLSGATVDLAAGIVLRDGARVPLTSRERVLLEVLLAARGAIVESGRLARRAGVVGGRAALGNAIHRLRAKLEREPAHPRHLLGVRGEGYRLDAPIDEPPAAPALHLRALRSLTEHVGLVMRQPDCVVYARRGATLVQVAAFGPKRAEDGSVRAPLVQRFDADAAEGLVGAAAASARPLRVPEVAADRRYLRDLVPAASELCVPILCDGAVVGVLDTESPRPAAHADALVEALVNLAAIAAPAFRLHRDPPGDPHG